jgi:biopolymer transport protein ExbB/TolQ
MPLQTIATLVAILGTMTAAPVTLVVIFLKSTHEAQAARHHELSRQIERTGERVSRLTEKLAAVQRNYATKEEWLRESLLVREALQSTRESLARLEAMQTGKHSNGETAHAKSRKIEKPRSRNGASP